MEHLIVSGIDNQTIIGECRFDKRTGEFCDFKPIEGEGTFMEEGVNLCDDDEVYRANGCLNLKHARGVYQIELGRLYTPELACMWLIHLLEKRWVTTEMLFSMVCILEKHFGYDLHEFEGAVKGRVHDADTR